MRLALIGSNRFAFQWVQKYAHLFGGDPDRITVAGESAGAASVVHHITAYGSRGQAPEFRQAIIQSAGWNPISGADHLEEMYQKFMNVLKVDSVEEARRLSFMAIRNASFSLTFVLRWDEVAFGAYDY